MSIQQHPTRGKTQPGRLDAVDRWVSDRLSVDAALVVDVGPGERADTLLALADTVQKRTSGRCRVVGVEIDTRRAVSLAQACDDRVDVLPGGFDLAGLADADLIRAMNVFRQYPVEDALPGYGALANKLRPGGLFLTGSCDKYGDIGSFWVFDSDGAKKHLVVWTTGENGFAPIQFRDWLPRDIRRLGRAENPFWSLEERWRLAWEKTRGDATPVDAFDRSITELERSGRARLVGSGLAEFDVPLS